MKKIVLAGFIGLLSVITLNTGCRYEEGPRFTIRSAKHRIQRTWVIEQYFENQVDKTSDFKKLFPDWSLILKNPEDYTYTLVYSTSPFLIKEDGSWEFLEGATKINLRKDKTGNNIWIIKRLKSNSLWVEQTDGNGKLIGYHLKSE